MSLKSGNIQRRRQVTQNAIENRLYTLVLESTTREHRVDFALQSEFANTRDDLFVGKLPVFQVSLHQFIVSFRGRVNQFLAVLFRASLQISRNLAVF